MLFFISLVISPSQQNQIVLFFAGNLSQMMMWCLKTQSLPSLHILFASWHLFPHTWLPLWFILEHGTLIVDTDQLLKKQAGLQCASSRDRTHSRWKVVYNTGLGSGKALTIRLNSFLYPLEFYLTAYLLSLLFYDNSNFAHGKFLTQQLIVGYIIQPVLRLTIVLLPQGK